MAVDYFSLVTNQQRNRQMEQQQQSLDMQRQRQALLNQATQQEMAHMAQLNPLTVQAKQAELDRFNALTPFEKQLAKAQAGTAETTQDRTQAEFDEYSSLGDYRDRMRALEEEVAGLAPDEARARLAQSQAATQASKASTNASYTNQQAKKLEMERLKKADQQAETVRSVTTLGKYAEQALKLPEGSQERMKFVKDAIPRLKKMGIGGDGQLDVILEDGTVSDAELTQVIQEANAFKQQNMKISDQVALEKLEMQKQKQKREQVKVSKEGLQYSDSALTTVKDIIGSYEKDPNVLEDISGPIDSRTPTLGQDEADLEEKIKALESKLTMANIQKMSGVLSDTDLKVLRESAANLSLRQSPQQIMKTIKNVENALSRASAEYSSDLGIDQDFNNVMNQYGI